MNYFLTGATGFIGQQLLTLLAKRQGKIYVLVRPESVHKIQSIQHQLGLSQDKLIPVTGDLSSPCCGVDIEKLGNIDMFYHLGAVYDLSADQASQQSANIDGTRHAIELAERLQVSGFHHISSIVAAGFFEGTFTENMFSEAVDVDKNAYFQTKHESEGIVRHKCSVPWRIYRPGIVVGHSQSGWMPKIDGPYYFFELINILSEALPRWIPLPIYKGNAFNIVPVDYVAKALDHISHKDKLDGQCFHLTNPHKQSFGEVINDFLKAAKGPTMKWDIPAKRIKDFLPAGAQAFLQNKFIVQRVKTQLLENLGIPKEVLLTEELNTHYDCQNTLSALEGTNIRVPQLDTYAARLWNYWEQHLNPEYLKPSYLSDVVDGKTVLITGGSEGIGREVADNCARAGAKVILVARTQSKLDLAVEEIKATGAQAYGYSCDLSDLDACDAMLDKVIEEHEFVDVLINNAGRSIRRSLSLTYERFHDFERVMQINYFSAIRLAMKLLPLMEQRKTGHVINISSIAALSKGSARFSSYMASKCALDAWSESANLEYASKNISFTNVHMPLVRTKMIAATKSYQDVSVLSPQEAGELVNVAMINRPREVNTLTGNLVRQMATLSPKLHKLIFSTLYQITDDSEAAKSTTNDATVKPTSKATRALDALQKMDLDKETLASIANILRGYHT